MKISQILAGLGVLFWVQSTEPRTASVLSWWCAVMAIIALILESIAP